MLLSRDRGVHFPHAHRLSSRTRGQGVNGAYLPLGGVGMRDNVAEFFRKNSVRECVGSQCVCVWWWEGGFSVYLRSLYIYMCVFAYNTSG